ncbi:MAG: gyrase subunit, partial [Gaiellaceae bacterium]|nr:gyrase subunit [Gaiellaceae bacterium]
RLLKQYEGWASSLRAAWGHEIVTFLEESTILDEGAVTGDAVVALMEGADAAEEPYTTELVDKNDEEIVVKVIERTTGLARTHRLKRPMFESSDYRSFVRVHEELKSMAGTPPFDVSLDKQHHQALSFEALRHEVMAVAQEGVKLQRFKGLGEMNADQLFDTAMDPGRRTLQQVVVDDEMGADDIFSRLMGDNVEPRRAFIEAHARDASLDV